MRTLDILSFAKCLNILDGEQFDYEEILKEFNRFKKLAFNYTDQYRQAKSDYMNNIAEDKRSSEGYKECYREITRISEKYGRRSFTFNTLVRSIAMVQKTKQQVTKERLKNKGIPPAFDPLMRAEETDIRRDLRKELEEWLENGSDEFLWSLKALMEKEWNRMKVENAGIVKLTNGTTTIIQWHSFNINDILSIAFVPKEMMDTILAEIGLRFKIKNRYSTDDGLIYIYLDKSSVYEECGGEHLEIPDKDAKVREIYRMFPWVQVVSKKVHKLLDRVARRLEGNYTYKHRAWIKNLVEKGWNRTKYVIGADMTKYSDTLDRNFIMTVLNKMGLPKKITEKLDNLYGMSILDSTLALILKGSRSSYQGQYGDFPMITICNLVLQRFIYHKVGQPCKEGYNAAVGDDTGMVFDRYDPKIMDILIDVYGCVGVNINRSKTGELIYGEGRIDFVKLEVDAYGVIEFLNTRTLNNDGVDAMVRDILDLMYVSEEVKWKLADTMFGPGAGERLKNLSIINGGLKDEPLTKADIALYLSRSQKLQMAQEANLDETYCALREMQRYLKFDYPDKEEHYLYETPLQCYLEPEDYEFATEPEELDEKLIMNIMNMNKLGLSEGEAKRYGSWLGVTPSMAKRHYELRDKGLPHDDILADIWSEINSYEVRAAFRTSAESKRGKEYSTMLPVLQGYYDEIEHIDVPDAVHYKEINPKDVADYQLKVKEYKALHNKDIIKERLKGIAEFYWITAFRHSYEYIKIKGDQDLERRLYGVSYNSKYKKLSKEEFDDFLLPYIKDICPDYVQFVETMNAAYNGSLLTFDPWTDSGI